MAATYCIEPEPYTRVLLKIIKGVKISYEPFSVNRFLLSRSKVTTIDVPLIRSVAAKETSIFALYGQTLDQSNYEGYEPL